MITITIANVSRRLAYLTACDYYASHPEIDLTCPPMYDQSPNHSRKIIANRQTKNRDTSYSKHQAKLKRGTSCTDQPLRLPGKQISTPMSAPDKFLNPHLERDLLPYLSSRFPKGREQMPEYKGFSRPSHPIIYSFSESLQTVHII